MEANSLLLAFSGVLSSLCQPLEQYSYRLGALGFKNLHVDLLIKLVMPKIDSPDDLLMSRHTLTHSAVLKNP
jgi:hypothetical protein